MWLQLLFVLLAIIVGARVGGIGLGVFGGLGLAVLTFIFGLEPTTPPIDVMLMIVAVITAAACMQAAGGLDLMVRGAEHLLRKRPAQITFLSPLVTYFFSFVAGTGHVAYSVLPVIAEVARETKIRPERPLGIAVIASQQAITASPISAATVALLGLLTGFNISLLDILIITIPSTLCGVFLGALYSLRVGKELVDDPEYQRRLKEGLLDNSHYELKDIGNKHKALLSVLIFVIATVFIVIFGSFDNLRPSHIIDGRLPRTTRSVPISPGSRWSASARRLRLSFRCSPKARRILAASIRFCSSDTARNTKDIPECESSIRRFSPASSILTAMPTVSGSSMTRKVKRSCSRSARSRRWK